MKTNTVINNKRLKLKEIKKAAFHAGLEVKEKQNQKVNQQLGIQSLGIATEKLQLAPQKVVYWSERSKQSVWMEIKSKFKDVCMWGWWLIIGQVLQ